MRTWSEKPFIQFGEAVLEGVSQVFFQKNWITGLIFLVGIFLGSFLAGIYAVLAVITATITALLLGISYDAIKQGLYSFAA